jgi:adenosylcobinamide-GDP ribazoletransferase
MYAAIAALQFLTRLPIPAAVPFEKPILGRSVAYFPMAGAIVGALTAGAAWLLGYVLPPWPAAVITLALWLGLSGGLHLDGWMDTADGVLSHRDKERMLDIMKDSRVGAMGVTAAILLLLLKASLLAELIGIGREWLLPVLVAASCSGRAAMSLAIAIWPAARKNEGIGSMFNEVNKNRVIWGSLSLALFAGASFLFNEINYLQRLSIVVVCLLLMSLIVGWLGSWLCRKLGGLTGDTYGAINEAVEAGLLLAAVCAIRLWV